LKVGRGLTSRPSPDEELWERKYYEVEAELDEGEDVEAARIGLEHALEQWLSGEIAIPRLDEADLELLPWISYITKRRCEKGDEPGWIFSDPSRHLSENQSLVSELVKAIKKVGKLELGKCVYSFSGDKSQFIRREKRR